MIIKRIELGKTIGDHKDKFIKDVENIRMHNQSQRAEECNK